MNYCVHPLHCGKKLIRPEDVTIYKRRPVLEILPEATGEVVVYHNCLSRGEERFNHVAPDITGATNNKYLHDSSVVTLP